MFGDALKSLCLSVTYSEQKFIDSHFWVLGSPTSLCRFLQKGFLLCFTQCKRSQERTEFPLPIPPMKVNRPWSTYLFIFLKWQLNFIINYGIDIYLNHNIASFNLKVNIVGLWHTWFYFSCFNYIFTYNYSIYNCFMNPYGLPMFISFVFKRSLTKMFGYSTLHIFSCL